MPRKGKIVAELSPEVVALLKRIADAIAPEHHAPPIGDTKRLVESDQRDHPVKCWPENVSLKLTPAEVEQVESAIEAGPLGYGPIKLDPKVVERYQAERKKWYEGLEPGVD